VGYNTADIMGLSLFI